MRRHGSERRRRWFLIAFSASVWLFLLNDLAGARRTFADGGLGPDGHHAAGVLGTLALWVVIASILRLRFLQFCAALLLGFGVHAALDTTGFRDLAALGIWTVACERGDGTACRNAAVYYDGGHALFAGSVDAGNLHRRACRLGGPDTGESCIIARSLGMPSHVKRDAPTQCVFGARSQCVKVARAYDDAGDYAGAYEWYQRACQQTGPSEDLRACEVLINSGFVEHRAAACDKVDDLCLFERSHRCATLTRRCDRARSPAAGVGRR